MPAPEARPPLDETRLTTPPGWRVEVVPEAGSTNALVTARAAEEPGLVVVTEHQVSGRGRLDRTWETPARAALTFSALVAPRRPVADWSWIPLVTGYAVVQALRDAGVADAGLKWPNDVLVAGRKVAGILVELAGGANPRAVIGVGLNVSTTADELPVPTATSLALEGHHPDRGDLLGSVLAHLASALREWAGSPDAFAEAFGDLCTTLAQEVRVELPDGETLVGTATAVDGHGRLVVDGRVISAGDVVHVRPVE